MKKHSNTKKAGDTISQRELAACFAIHRALNTLMFTLRKRLAAGARVEPGRYRAQHGLAEVGEPSQDFTGMNSWGVTVSRDGRVPELLGENLE